MPRCFTPTAEPLISDLSPPNELALTRCGLSDALWHELMGVEEEPEHDARAAKGFFQQKDGEGVLRMYTVTLLLTRLVSVTSLADASILSAFRKWLGDNSPVLISYFRLIRGAQITIDIVIPARCFNGGSLAPFPDIGVDCDVNLAIDGWQGGTREKAAVIDWPLQLCISRAHRGAVIGFEGHNIGGSGQFAEIRWEGRAAEASLAGIPPGSRSAEMVLPDNLLPSWGAARVQVSSTRSGTVRSRACTVLLVGDDFVAEEVAETMASLYVSANESRRRELDAFLYLLGRSLAGKCSPSLDDKLEKACTELGWTHTADYVGVWRVRNGNWLGEAIGRAVGWLRLVMRWADRVYQCSGGNERRVVRTVLASICFMFITGNVRKTLERQRYSRRSIGLMTCIPIVGLMYCPVLAAVVMARRERAARWRRRLFVCAQTAVSTLWPLLSNWLSILDGMPPLIEPRDGILASILSLIEASSEVASVGETAAFQLLRFFVYMVNSYVFSPQIVAWVCQNYGDGFIREQSGRSCAEHISAATFSKALFFFLAMLVPSACGWIAVLFFQWRSFRATARQVK